MLLTIWMGLGYYMMIFLAGLQNIPEELYDAALIDGCNNLQKHWHVSLPGLRPQITFVAVISSLAAIEVFNEIFILTGGLGGILNSGVTMVFYLWRQAFRLNHAGYASAIAMVLLVITLVFSIVNIRLLERGTEARLMAHTQPCTIHAGASASAGKLVENIFWYIVLCLVAVVTVFPFVWVFFTSFKGPNDAIFSVPPQLIPHDPTFANYVAGLEPTAGGEFFLEQHLVAASHGDLERAVHFAGGLSVGQDEIPRARCDFLPAPGDVHRAAPAHLHPQLCPGRQCLPLLRHDPGA